MTGTVDILQPEHRASGSPLIVPECGFSTGICMVNIRLQKICMSECRNLHGECQTAENLQGECRNLQGKCRQMTPRHLLKTDDL